MTRQSATVDQVRKHYEERGFDVKIDDKGHVEYRDCAADGDWLEGRYVSEYRVYVGQSGVVYLT